jgi:hypothetical protein
MCALSTTDRRPCRRSVTPNVVANAGNEVSSATRPGSGVAPAPSTGQRATRNVVCQRSSHRHVRAPSAVRRGSGPSSCPIAVVAAGLELVAAATADSSSASDSTVAAKPAPASRLASWSAARVRHRCAPTSPPPRAATAAGHSSGSSRSATHVSRSAGAPPPRCCCSSE